MTQLSGDYRDQSVISNILLYDNPDTWRDDLFDDDNRTMTFFKASTTEVGSQSWVLHLDLFRFHLQFALKDDVPVYRLIMEPLSSTLNGWFESRHRPGPIAARISFRPGDGTIWEFRTRFRDLAKDDEALNFYYSEWTFCEPCLSGDVALSDGLSGLARTLRYLAQEASPGDVRAAMRESGLLGVEFAEAKATGTGMDEDVIYGVEEALAARDAFIAELGNRAAPTAAAPGTTAGTPAAPSGDPAAAKLVTEGQQCFESAEVAEAVMWEQAMQQAKAVCEAGGGFLDFASLKPASIQTNQCGGGKVAASIGWYFNCEK